MHEAYVEKMKSAVTDGPTPEMFGEMMKAWGPMNEAGMAMWQQMLGQMGGKAPPLNDTIYALSSGAPPAAVALVRISGPKADAALEALAGTLPAPRMATLAKLRDGDEVLDNALIIRFPGPASATGEDVAELHLHGGRAVVASVLAALGRIEGLRPAAPGEFTRRAFENGRIDLAEAEGLADLLEAETEAQRRQALALAGGALGRQVAAWQEELLALAAVVEAALDFSDEDDVAPAPRRFRGSRLAALREALTSWLARPPAERLKDGIRVVIAGPPNAGKSSLLNALVGRDAAIVSAIPGTTRDLIEAPVAFGGIPFLLIDTAGLRETGRRDRDDRRRPRPRLGRGGRFDPLARAARRSARRARSGFTPKSDLGAASSSGRSFRLRNDRRGPGRPRPPACRSGPRHSLPREGEVALNARHRTALAEVASRVARGRNGCRPADCCRIAPPRASRPRPDHRQSRCRGHARRPVRAVSASESECSTWNKAAKGAP